MKRIGAIGLFLAILLPVVLGGNILGVFIHPGYSHFRAYCPILKGLAARGHNVTVVTYFSAENLQLPNYKEILLTGEYPHNTITIDEISPSRSILKLITEFYDLEREGRDSCQAFYKSNAVAEVRRLHAEEPFELTMLEVFNTDCILGLVQLLQTPIVGQSSCAMMPWHYDRVGLPDFPGFIPSEFVSSSSEMDFLERVVNFFIVKVTKVLYRLSQLNDNDIIRQRLGIDMDVREAVKNISLVLVNQHYSLSGARPLSPRVIEIGGAHIPNVTRPLPKELATFLRDSNDGIIFISWGSLVNISSIPTEILADVVNALKKFKQRVVWKWDSSEKPAGSENIYFSKWIPQNDLLCHPKVRVFWSHGGLLGSSEAVHCGVPMVITPMYGDQYLNAKALVQRKMGKILSYQDITEENVYNSIAEVLQPSYLWNAKYVSDVYRNRQNPPLETAIWWIEHVLHTKGSNLTYSPSVDMNWFVYYSLDAILTLLFALILAISLPIYCLKAAWRLCRRPVATTTPTKRTLLKHKTKTS